MSVTNRVYKVLVTTGGNAAATTSALTAGQYIVLKEDGTPFTAGNTIAQGDKFQIAVGAPDGTVIFSDLIALKDITSYEKTAYRARVEQVATVVLGTPVAGLEYSLLINDKSDKEILPMRQALRRYTVLAAVGETATSLGDKYVARITADPASIVTASNAAGTITLTAKTVATTQNAVGQFYPQYYFEAESSQVDLYGYFQAFGTTTYTTAPDFGSGNGYQVRRLETQGIGYTGVTNRRGFPIEQGQNLSVIGTNYDIYIIDNLNLHDTNVVNVGTFRSPITTYIAVTTGQGTALEAILSPLIQSAPNENLAVVG